MTPRGHHRRSSVVALSAGAVVLAGCTTGGTTEQSGDEGAPTVVRGAWITDPTTFNPPLTQATDDYRAARLVYDTVVRRDLDGELIPALASSWEQSSEGLTLTIGEGHTCADGTEITPTVVADSLTYLADPETGSVHTTGIFGQGEVTVSADEEAGTVAIELSEPHSEVLAGLAIPQAGIICPAGLEDPEGMATGSVEGAFSGPYVLAEATTGVSYEFELREDYDSWVEYAEPLAGTPPTTLTFVVGAADAVANQLLTDELDVAPVSSEELARFEGDDSFELTTATTGEYYIMFNGRDSSPFADADMRRALAQVIDPDALREIIDPEGELIATLGDANMACANTDFSLLQDYDMDSAAQTLDGVSVDVIGTTAIGTNGAGAVYVQEQLRSAGADVELRNLDVGTWVSQILDEPDSWDVTLYATVNNLGTISWGLGTVIGKPLAEGGRNESGVQNDEATEALAAALSADSEEEMCAQYERAQQAALESADFVPISMVTQSILSREGVSVAVPGGREDYTTIRVND